MSTIQAQITEIARKYPDEGLTALNQYLTEDLLKESFRQLKKKAAAGVDGKDYAAYEQEIEQRLPGLVAEIKTGSYRALPVKRGFVPKPGTTELRPLGIPAIEDKVAQKAVTEILVPIYEQEFYPFSYGFRPGKGPLMAVQALHEAIGNERTNWIVELDIRKFFDTLSHSHLREFLRKRVRDGVILRLIDKWLKAGVMEAGAWKATEEGTPQGGIISPLLANLYLHEVLDKWFAERVKCRLKGRSFMIRYADDAVMGFEHEEDARRVMEALPKRFALFALSLNMQKTRIVDFQKPNKPGANPETFDFLGFTHYWGRSRNGRAITKLQTAKDRLARSCKAVWKSCRRNMHLPISEQSRRLNWKLRGHYSYYGVTHNIRALRRYHFAVVRTWHQWLNRRGGPKRVIWQDYVALLTRNPLTSPRIFHSLYRPCESFV